MKLISALHPPSRLSMPLGVESGLLPSLLALLAIGSGIRPSLFSPDYLRVFSGPGGCFGVVHNFSSDLSQNCLFVAFTPLLGLDVGSDQLSVFSLFIFVFQGVGGRPGVPEKARTCLPFIEEGAVTFPKVAPFRSHPFASGGYQTSWNCQTTPGHVQNKPTRISQAPGSIPRANQPIGTHGSPTWPGHCPDPAQLPMT
ncbi:hypothetical protein IGI04_036384 [Brassica rapa subsp. trilocularis]|uniref:Uncharacterized protein n=1 Tax=Brassica rapa subsp. trilocularis TaxID=1813537 RepID=A0ABQ7LHC4_BRACM|nr:hypothetical protein IGI04_036384 [Brassica rapa subsp. trilocularis]